MPPIMSFSFFPFISPTPTPYHISISQTAFPSYPVWLPLTHTQHHIIFSPLLAAIFLQRKLVQYRVLLDVTECITKTWYTHQDESTCSLELWFKYMYNAQVYFVFSNQFDKFLPMMHHLTKPTKTKQPLPVPLPWKSLIECKIISM